MAEQQTKAEVQTKPKAKSAAEQLTALHERGLAIKSGINSSPHLLSSNDWNATFNGFDSWIAEIIEFLQLAGDVVSAFAALHA